MTDITEALATAKEIRKQKETTELLKPSDFNNLAIRVLRECYDGIMKQTPVEVASHTEKATYKQQMLTAQSLFAAAPVQDLKSAPETSIRFGNK
jgi:hypothetical protein